MCLNDIFRKDIRHLHILLSIQPLSYIRNLNYCCFVVVYCIVMYLWLLVLSYIWYYRMLRIKFVRDSRWCACVLVSIAYEMKAPGVIVVHSTTGIYCVFALVSDRSCRCTTTTFPIQCSHLLQVMLQCTAR